MDRLDVIATFVRVAELASFTAAAAALGALALVLLQALQKQLCPQPQLQIGIFPHLLVF